jgi:FkbM family methyltransferase
MNRQQLLHHLNKAGQFASVTKGKRFIKSPLRYVFAVGFRELVYPFVKKGVRVKSRLITGQKVELILPSSTDIYLAGCKTDDSEIRLARFMINHIKDGDVVLDAGAHIGYYSLLSSFLVGQNGRVAAVEASPAALELLRANTGELKNIHVYATVLGSGDGEISFYEFPVQYAEYNSVNSKQYEHEPWFAANKPVLRKLKSMRGDSLLNELQLVPGFIKIDVEGNEAEVISGLTETIQTASPAIIMEFVGSNTENSPHIRAEKLLLQAGYRSYQLLENGEPALLIQATNEFVQESKLRSDNILYLK